MRFCATSIVFQALFLAHCVSAYFSVTEPTKESKWANGQVHTVRWNKGLNDNVDLIDIELTTISGDGLILVAKNVPTKPGGVNIFLENVPPADDWVVVCINSTHGISHGVSPPFAILASSASTEASKNEALDKAPTVTITSGPNPTAFFQTTLPANGAVSLQNPFVGGLGGLLAVAGLGLVSAAWVVL